MESPNQSSEWWPAIKFCPERGWLRCDRDANTPAGTEEGGEYLIRGYWKMGIKTGRPRGRPKSAKNKRTVEREADMREMAARIGNAVGGALPHINL